MASQTDSPLPGPGDAVAIGIIVIGLIDAGLLSGIILNSIGDVASPAPSTATAAPPTVTTAPVASVALACLDAILEANRDRDHDRWLARSIAAHRVLIFLDAGRYAEAEQASLARAQLGFEDVSERWEHALGTAHTLDALGRAREATAILEDALGYPAPLHHLPGVLGVLVELVRLSEKLAQPVDSKWLSLAEAVAERYGVEMPANDSVGKAILTLAETVRGMVPKRPTDGE